MRNKIEDEGAAYPQNYSQVILPLIHIGLFEIVTVLRHSSSFPLCMYLSSLKVNGFKSFADATHLRYEPGVTAIVGPNGCGKSNIADAVRWVLGEQSAKALRGGKMQDVIFEGTDKRKPVNLCEVSLILTDCEKELGSEFNEIEISRRAHRDGGSNYYINGKACRLKDIQRLFMDTGIGRTSYSIMAQGQIDQILSSKPEERRSVFEEAAGISKYKSQRREAMNKLALVENNLSRVTDVISEISRQIGSLKRQATKAIRYKKISHRLKHLDIGNSAHQFGELRSSLSDVDKTASTLQTEVSEMQEDLEGKDSRLTVYKEERQVLIQQVQDAQQGVFDLRSAKEQAANQVHMAQIKISSLEERIEQANEETASYKQQISEIASRLDTSSQDKQLHMDVLGNSDEIFHERNRELADIEAKLESTEGEIQQLKVKAQQAEENSHSYRDELSSLEVEKRTSEDRLTRLQEEESEQAQLLAQAEKSLQEFQDKATSTDNRLQQLQSELETDRNKVLELRDDFRVKQVSIQELDRNVAQKSARLKLLQQLQEKLEGYGEGAKAVLKGQMKGSLEGREFQPMTTSLSVKSGYNQAIEALLGSAVEAIAVGDADTVIEIFRQLEERQVGRICVKLPAEIEKANDGMELPEWLKPALDFIENAESADEALVSTLSASYLVEDIAAFLKWWEGHRAFSFLHVASIKGELVNCNGVATGGHQKAKNSSILQRESELRQISKELETDQKALEGARNEAESLNKRLEEAEGAVEATRQGIDAANQELTAIRAETRNAEKSINDLKAKAARFNREKELIGESQVRSNEKLEAAKLKLTEYQTTLNEARKNIEGSEKGLVEIRADRDKKRESLSQAKFDLHEKKQKLDMLNQGLVELEQRSGELNRLIESKTRDIEDWNGQISEFSEAIAQSKNRTETIDTELEGAKTHVEKSRQSLVNSEEKIGILEKEQTFVREKLDALRSSLSNQQVQIAEKRSRLEFIQEEMQREYGVDLRLVDWKFEIWKAHQPVENLPQLDLDSAVASKEEEEAQEIEGQAEEESVEAADPVEEGVVEPTDASKPQQPTEEELAALDETDWGKVQTDVKTLRKRIQNLGAVNLVAIEEYGELKERHEFLKTQYDDLVTSRDKLIAAIDEINTKSREQFAATFEQIRENFKSTFQTLFSGGKADLQLIESEDILESGIEIVAQPPGTRLKSVSLLSGGQRTMTAVALLFAIYLVKPSPFCVLDELDAPLDESNIGRFTALLKQFTQHSQFIIITHNKRTIAAAEAIYGVTMEEKGVSKVVSMKFNSTHEDSDLVTLELEAASA